MARLLLLALAGAVDPALLAGLAVALLAYRVAHPASA
jgi:hypothetical protein